MPYDMTASKHQKLPRNKKGRDFVVGDVHGHYKALKYALKQVNFDPDYDRLISVGDLVNRGKDSHKCLKLIRKKWFYGVLGNHELLMMDCLLNGRPFEDWYQRGGQWFTNLSLRKRQKIEQIVYDHLIHMPHSLTIKSPDLTIGVCHADPPKNWKDAEKGRLRGDRFVTARHRILRQKTKQVKNIDLVFVGHTAQPQIKALGNVIYMDTGVHKKGGQLSLLECPTHSAEQFLQTIQNPL